MPTCVPLDMSGIMAYPKRVSYAAVARSATTTTRRARDVNGNDKEHSVKRELVFPRAT